MNLEQAIAGRSKIRNVCIAEIFSRMGIIEQWGTGIQRMIQGCKEYGVREPEFIDMGDAFRVNFYRSGTEKDKIENFSALYGTERRINEFILDNPGITQEQIAENMGMSKNGIRYTMGKLKDKGILVRTYLMVVFPCNI